MISGSNNGIGREASIQFAKWGANLILISRDAPNNEIHPLTVVDECKEAAAAAGHEKSQIEWWEADYTRLSDVEALAKRWLDTERPLDILCNNAGVGSSPGGNSVFKTKDGFEFIHQINLLAHVLLTLHLIPSLAKAKEPRVICTTSCFHYLGRFNLKNFNGELGRSGQQGVSFYQNNKLWFQVWLTELQRRLLQHEETKHITVNGVHPGYVNSGIWNLNGLSLFAGISTLVVQAAAWVLGINEQQGSLTILNAATNPEAGANPAIQGVGPANGKGGGRYFSRIEELEPMPHTKDPDCRCRVWRKVNDELKLQEKGLLDLVGLEYTE